MPKKKQIKRGIYRDLPDTYSHPKFGKYGLKSKTPIRVISVQREGQREPFHVKKLQNGLRIYIGTENKLLSSGLYTYRIQYTIARQIASKDDVAQLYWNVTGNGWSFPIDKSSANIELPNSAYIRSYAAWVGLQGSVENSVSFDQRSSKNITASTLRSLLPYEGLTVLVKFNADILSLTNKTQWQQLYDDNVNFVRGWVVLVLMFLFYFVMWLWKGIDPAKGIIVARYKPIEYLSAAAHRAVYENRADNTSFAVGVLSLAIKGFLHVDDKKSGSFKLTRVKKEPKVKLPSSEQILMDGLFKNTSSVTVGEKYDPQVDRTRKRYEEQLNTDYAKRAHRNHIYNVFIGGIMGLIGLVFIFIDQLESLIVPAFFFVFIGVALLPILIRNFKNVSFTLVFAFLIFAYAIHHAYMQGIYTAIPLFFYALNLGLFSYLLPAPKKNGQKMIDQIEGFKLYLSKAEHDSLKRLSLPKKTPQLYEEMLPYAIALGLETQWSDQFIDELAESKKSGHSYHQHNWYRGMDNSHSSNFASGLAAGLATSVVAASTPPSSSSSGGGSSGGGGGGGGGW